MRGSMSSSSLATKSLDGAEGNRFESFEHELPTRLHELRRERSEEYKKRMDQLREASRLKDDDDHKFHVHSSWSECGVCCWNVLSVGYCSGWKEGETEWWRLRTFIGSLVGWAVKSQFYSVGFWGDYSGHVPRCSFGRSAARFGMSSIRRSHVWESTPHLLRNHSTSCCTTMLMRLIFFPILVFSFSTTATRSFIQAVLGPN